MSLNDYDDSHQEGVCPVCESSNVQYGSFCLNDCGGHYEVECLNCGAKFNEAYDFAFAGHFEIRRKEDL